MFEELSHAVVLKIKHSKSSYYQEKLASANSKETFSLINGLMNCSGSPSLPTSTSDHDLAESFVQCFQQKVLNIRKQLDDTCVPGSLNVEQPATPPPLCEFRSQTQEDIGKIISQCATKSCSLDTIPTSLLKEDQVLQTVLPSITDIINRSLATGVFPDCLKQAQVMPLLKKNGLDTNDFKNYRPVSNIPFVSKVIEKVVAKQLTNHLTQHNLHDKMQSAYKRGTSTETALLRIKADIDRILDEGDGVLVVLLDLSAAFDTIDHDILLQRLQEEVGLQQIALQWVRSYLANRRQAVHINGSVSQSVNLSIGVPQGSVLGPLLFLVYLLPLKLVIEKHSVPRHGFADDTQLYHRLSLKNTSVCEKQVRIMEQCLSDVRIWMKANKLKLNESKTEVLVIASKNNIKFADNINVKIGNEVIKLLLTVYFPWNSKSTKLLAVHITI